MFTISYSDGQPAINSLFGYIWNTLHLNENDLVSGIIVPFLKQLIRLPISKAEILCDLPAGTASAL